MFTFPLGRSAAVLLTLVLAAVIRPADGHCEPLGIGSKAPSLSVEHWLQNGNGFFDPVSKLEEGKVYVVEFWATWCPPCVASMPHLAEMQQKYRGRDVQIVSVSSEPLETVEAFMKRKHPQAGVQVAALTSAYTLGVDSDETTYDDYMTASRESGIPMAFIVGKTGKIEWLGHPMLMDEPLEQVVEGAWDREAFKLEYDAQKRGQEIGQRLSQLYSADRIDEAIVHLDREIEAMKFEPMRKLLIKLKNEIKYESDRVDQEVLTAYGELLDEAKRDDRTMLELALSTLNALRRGSDLKTFEARFLSEFKTSVAKMPRRMKVEALQLLAAIHVEQDDADGAIRAMEQAVQAAKGTQQKRLQAQLDALKRVAAGEEP